MALVTAGGDLCFTYADIEASPDDGLRYELSSGSLVVSPAPAVDHQRLVLRIATLLHRQCPPDREVFPRLDVYIADDMVKQPDVLVVHRSIAHGKNIAGVPDLLVEVHSPSTRVRDLTEKRYVYAELGVPAYWLVDPDTRTITILHRNDSGLYDRAAVVDRVGTVHVDVPFPIEVDGRAVFA